MKSKTYFQMIMVFTLVLTDAAMAGLALFAAYWARLWIPWPNEAQNVGGFLDYTGVSLIHTFSVLIVFSFSRLYHLARSRSRVDEFFSILTATTVGALVGVAMVSLLLKNSPLELDYSRGIIGYAWAFTIAFVTLGRLVHGSIYARLRKRGWGRARVLVVGANEVGRMIVQKIQSNPGLGYEVVGFVTVNGQEETVMGAPALGRAADLSPLIEAHDVDEVIIAMPEATHQEILMLISECERGKVTIKVFPDVFQIMASQVSIGDLGGLPLLTVRDIALSGWKRVAKRMMDVVGSAAALVLLSPILMGLAILVKATSPGPVFYVQERMGLDARPFKMLKFRSMRPDAEADGAGWTVENDPRVTWIGRIMRRLNLDELPQFINVLIGEMSLVGPRPERPVYVNQFRRSIPRYMNRHWEKAGMTGWAQVNGLRGDTSIVERTKYDLWYIENWSLSLDVKIILRTVFNFFSSPNAY